jgi:type II secretory pathway pseudopilin PulG
MSSFLAESVQTKLNNSKLNRKYQGFALVEIMIAVLIITIGLFGLLAATTMGSRGAIEAVERTEAVSIASSTLVKIKSSGSFYSLWNGVDIMSMSGTPPAELMSAVQLLKEDADSALKPSALKVEVLTPGSITPCALAPCQVAVTVEWQSASKQPRSLSLSGWVGVQ